MENQPIFIAGPDRSGTTLMFALLASHPNILMVRRTNMWRYFYKRYGDLSKPDNFESCLSDMVRYKRMSVLEPNPEEIRKEFWQGEPSYGRLFSVFHRQHAEQIGKLRWGDKSLHTEHYADSLFTEFPDAKIIHMSRDPRDRYASVKKRHGRTISRLGASLGRWLFSMRTAHRNMEKYPNNYIIVRYEDLALQPEKTLQKVCAFLGEDYVPEMLKMGGAAEYRDSGGNSSFGTISPGTVSSKPIGRFRQVLSHAEISTIQMFAGREMEKLDYQLDKTEFSPGERLSFLAELPLNLVRMYGWTFLTMRKIRNGEPIPPHRLQTLAGG